MHKAKKSLGQNFLKSELVLNKIVEAGEVSEKDVILEIGPGKGALTEKLLEKAGVVIAVEKDRELFELLKEKFSKEIESKKLILLNDDILKFSAENFRGESENILRSYKIVANIPYNITGAILKKFLTEENQPELMVLMVQHEVAKRIMGANPTSPRLRRAKESILSISIKAYGEPRMIMKVGARYFSPAPKVDSAVISIKNISRKMFSKNNLDEEKFWEIVKTGFAHKRKKLSGNLKSLKNYKENAFIKSLENKRAEDLALSDWIKLTLSTDL